MKIYLFDVDRTLCYADGPVNMQPILELHAAGHAVGLCGNWARALREIDSYCWTRLFSFIGPMAMTKAAFMLQIKTFVRADDYVMVGNDRAEGPSPNDQIVAELVGWRFVEAQAFADGAR